MKILSEYIAPWALPNEGIPVHLFWQPDFQYDTIIIKLPKDVILKDVFNVKSFEQKKSVITINELKTPNFFGFVISSKKLPEKQHKKEQIYIEFLSEGKTLYSHIFNINIFRPKLSLVEAPSKIVFTDDADVKNLLNITLEVSGFGQIQIRIEVSTGGEFTERAEPLYEEIVRRMITVFRTGEELKTEEEPIKINPLYLQKKAQEYVEKIERGILPSFEISKEDLMNFRNWIVDKENRRKIMELLSRHLENLLIESLIFYFDKHPADNVTLAQGRPATFIESATRQLRIRFRYRDALMNEYEPVEVSIPVEDKRRETQTSFELPINLKWIQKTISPIKEGEI